MKSVLLIVSGLALLGGCSPLSDSGKPHGPFHPGGEVYQPQEFVAEKPEPAEPPFGTYFEDTKESPPKMADPYWIRGYWAWKNDDWEWINGRWVERPRPGLLWINPQSYLAGRIYWRSGYWQ